MSLPFTTTTITIERPSTAEQDPYESATFTTQATGVPAVIGSVSGREQDLGGSLEVLGARLAVEPGVDVQAQDVITDETTGLIWEVGWIQSVTGFGLDHVEGSLKVARGGASG